MLEAPLALSVLSMLMRAVRLVMERLNGKFVLAGVSGLWCRVRRLAAAFRRTNVELLPAVPPIRLRWVSLRRRKRACLVPLTSSLALSLCIVRLSTTFWTTRGDPVAKDKHRLKLNTFKMHTYPITRVLKLVTVLRRRAYAVARSAQTKFGTTNYRSIN